MQKFNSGRVIMLGNDEAVTMDMYENKSGLRVRLVSKLRAVTIAAALGVAALVPLQCSAATTTTGADGIVTTIAVSGGNDTINPGTTCVKLDVGVSTSCAAGYVAIPNNNSKLINAALAAKATNRPVTIAYGITDNPDQHCPYLAFTRCVAVSIIIK
jgi:hypothetical protein